MIALHGIDKVFAAGNQHPPVVALAGIDLAVGHGDVFGIIGPSGAGKSTLIRVINMLERPTAGRVVVGGVDMTTLDGPALRAARRSIGMIFQHFNLLSLRTVFDNVALPLELAGLTHRERMARIEPLLELVGLTDKRDRYPAELSGGQKQRVGIARALASNPKVLLCDEATSALDPETTRAILRLLADINRRLGLTIVLITHEMSVIKEICDRVAVLENGRIVEQGRVFDLFVRPQAEITRRFVAAVVGAELPEPLARRIVPEAGPGSATVLRIIFHGETATEPLISVASRRFGVDLNILHGRIDAIQDAPFGTLVVAASGTPGAVQATLQFLISQHHDVEVLGHVAASLRAAG
jgi:D-methionine transport system ATP-binding protein